MNEADWQECGDPLLLWEQARGKMSLRKYRLFVCAACRIAWGQIWPGRCRHAVEASELYAEGEITRAELNDARSQAYNVVHSIHHSRRPPGPYDPFLLAACEAAGYHPADLARALQFLLRAGVNAGGLAHLFREIAGVACFRPIDVQPAWLTWRDRTVVNLAQTAETDVHRGYFDYHRLAVLADALEEAGCDSQDLLAHLRGPGPHVRGCWAVDLLLGKE